MKSNLTATVKWSSIRSSPITFFSFLFDPQRNTLAYSPNYEYTLLAFYLNPYWTVIGPPGFLSGRQWPAIDFSRMLAGCQNLSTARKYNGHGLWWAANNLSCIEKLWKVLTTIEIITGPFIIQINPTLLVDTFQHLQTRQAGYVLLDILSLNYIILMKIPKKCNIPSRKTYLYKFDPLKPNSYIVKLGFTGVYFLFLLKT